MSAARDPIAVIGTGYVGLVTAAGFAELGSDVWCVDIDAEKIERLRGGEVPIYEPGLKELLERNSERLHFSTELADALDHARLLFVAVGTPPTYSGDADLSAVHAVVDAIPDSDRHALVMKSTVPCGTGAALQRVLKRARPRRPAVRLLPGVPEGGLGGQGLPAPRPGRGGRRRRLGRRRRGRALCAAAGSARAHRHRQRRDGQARLERLPRDQDLIHQRDRERLRGDRRRRGRGRPRNGSRRPHRLEVPAGRDRLRRLLLPQGRRRAQAARRQLRLPLPAAERRDPGQRPAEAARDRQAAAPPRPAGGQARGAARSGLQAQHRRHARGLLAGAGRAPAGRRRPDRRVRPGRRGCGACADGEPSSSPPTRWKRCATPMPPCW